VNSHLAKAISVQDMLQQVPQRCPPDTPIYQSSGYGCNSGQRIQQLRPHQSIVGRSAKWQAASMKPGGYGFCTIGCGPCVSQFANVTERK